MAENASIHIHVNDKPKCAPTHRCFVCDKLENPLADVSYNQFWLCEDCLSRLKDVLYPLGLTYADKEDSE